jgi:hypothetical protein
MQDAVTDAPAGRLVMALAEPKATAPTKQSNCARLVVLAVPVALGGVVANAVRRSETDGIEQATSTVPIN